MNIPPRFPIRKKILFASIPLLFFLVVAEFGLRIYFGDAQLDHSIALVHAYRLFENRLHRQQAATCIAETTGYVLELEELTRIHNELENALYDEENRALLIRFKEEYEHHFRRLVKETQDLGSRLLVLYLPSLWDRPERIERIMRPCVAFFRALADKYHVDFLGLDVELMEASLEQVTLYPADYHLSRAGNEIIAMRLAKYLHRFKEYRSPHHFRRHPERMGDFIPDFHGTVHWRSDMPFVVISNSQGLRMDHDLAFPKTRQRILILGDSYTFGPYIPNEETYPDILNRTEPDLEVINAGYPAYTVIDEADLFHDRAKYTEPDLTILQVLDNDILGFYSVMLNLFSRAKRLNDHHVSPSPLEKRVLDHILGTHAFSPKFPGNDSKDRS